MKRILFAIISLLFFAETANCVSAKDPIIANPYQVHFDKAYQLYPDIPKGTLEAVAFTNTRFQHITSAEAESCTGMPRAYGVMGLILDGKNYFSNNLKQISNLSHISENEILNSPEKNILAYAKSFHILLNSIDRKKNTNKTDQIASVLIQLSELPNTTTGQNFALNTQLYGMLSFMNDKENQALYKFPDHNLDLKKYFGEENFKVLSGSHITLSVEKIKNENGNSYEVPEGQALETNKNDNTATIQSPDYAPALWAAASSCNYSSGRSQAISAVTIHFVQGSYAGCIGWFQNCSAGVSAHYVLRSSDGQVTQMVLESNTGWHVGSQNPYTIGLEHEGFVSSASWFTTAMYSSSAALCRDICGSGYGINPKRTGFWPWLNTTYYNTSSLPGSCAKIKGHMHYPSQTHTDPGPNWNWDYFYKLVNSPAPAPALYSTATGNFYDSGGASSNYNDDERLLWTIAPPGATNVTLTFSSFNVENTWDYMYVYDGADVWAPLIGYYTGATNPGTLVANSGTMTIEFRSDCSTTAPGWNATWQSNATTITPANLAIATAVCPNLNVVLNWTNSGPGWYVDVTDDVTWADYYNKAVPNLTTVTCPGSFANITVPTKFLAFQPSTTYYWRIWDGTSHTYGNSFMTPSCTYNYPSCTGTFDDTGGSGNPYSGNEDYLTVIQPPGASSVSISFTSFDLELNYDSLWIYNGGSTSAPLLGVYTGTVGPGTVTANTGTMAIRFKADPFINNSGWTSTWSCVLAATGVNESILNNNSFKIYPNPSAGVFNLIVADELKRSPIEIYNALGEKIITLAVDKSNISKIDLSSQPGGIYFIHLRSENGTLTQKLVIDK